MRMNCCCSRESMLWIGIIAFLVGGVILLQTLDYIPEETWSFFWPILLVVIGLKFMAEGGKKNACMDECGHCESPMEMASMPKDTSKKPKAKKKPSKTAKKK